MGDTPTSAPEIEAGIEDATRRAAEARRAQARAADLEAQIAATEDRIGQLAADTVAESADVDRLERPSLAAFFWKLLGHHEERLEREKQEAAEARLRLDQESRQVVLMQQALATARAQAERLDECEAEAARWRAWREAQALESDPRGGAREEYMDLHDREQAARALAIHFGEALRAGEDAAEAVEAVRRALDHALGWATWDLVGGGALTAVAKHSRLDDAQDRLPRAQQALDAFRRELRDIPADLRLGELRVDVDRFVDVFFDNVFQDYRVRDRIESARNRVRSIESAVRGHCAELRDRIRGCQTDIEALQLRRARMAARG